MGNDVRHWGGLVTCRAWERAVECLRERKPNGLHVDWAWPRIAAGLAIDRLAYLGFICLLVWAMMMVLKITQMGLNLGSK